MSRLKSEVEVMIGRDDQLDEVLNSTTRFYLERIRQMSADLPEEIVCLEEASSNLISSLPKGKRGYKMGMGMENVEAKAFGRILKGVVERVAARQMRIAWERI